MSETSNESVTTATEKKKAAPKKTATAKKTVAAKTTAEAKPASEKKPAAPRKPRAKKESSVITDAETRYRMIEEAAYYIAEKHGFTGNSADFWVEAEAQIRKQLGEK